MLMSSELSQQSDISSGRRQEEVAGEDQNTPGAVETVCFGPLYSMVAVSGIMKWPVVALHSFGPLLVPEPNKWRFFGVID